jgi:hypothetical protein
VDYEERILTLERRMDVSDNERQSMLEILQGNQRNIEAIANDTKELRELWSEARSAFRFFTRCMAALRWTIKFIVLPVVFVLAAIYAWSHEGKPPTWLKSIADIVE